MADKNLLGRITDAIRVFRDGVPPPVPREGEVSYADPLRLFKGATPYNPDILISRKGYYVIDKMRDDDQIKACMAFKKLSVTAAGYKVISPPDQPEDWEVTRFMADQLSHLDGHFSHVLYEILSAMDYGFSVSEKVWHTIPEGEWAGMLGYKAIKTRKPHYFGFLQDEFGNIESLEQGNVPGGFTAAGRKLDIGKFVIYSYMEEFDNPYGKSDLTSAYRWWWNKDNAVKWLMMMLERYGIPPLFGIYDPAEISGSNLRDLQTIFQKLQAATNVLIPGKNGENRAFDLEFPEVGGQVATVFKPSLDHFDTAIARALLMPGLLGLSPDQVSGSLARSRTSFDMFLLVLEFIRNELEELVNEQIVKPLIDLNFNVQQYPQFVLNDITDKVRVDLLKSWAEMVGIGAVAQTAEDEMHIRTQLGFPERKEDDEEADMPMPDMDDDEEDEDMPMRQRDNIDLTDPRLSGIKVKLHSVELDTGKTVMQEEQADTALLSIQRRIQQARELVCSLA